MSIDQQILCIQIEDIHDPLLDKVEKTYNASFPEEERRDFSLVRKMIQDNSYFKVFALFKENDYAGFITAWEFDDFFYVEHFAIDESARNGGIGAKAMKQFLLLCNSPVVLEVEMPLDEMSRRRIGFYERLGFKLDGHDYQQPPYRESEGWLDMRLMSYGEIDLKKSFGNVKEKVYKYVYGQ